MIAALLRAGQVEMLAQRIEQRDPRAELELRSAPLTVRVIGILSGSERSVQSAVLVGGMRG